MNIHNMAIAVSLLATSLFADNPPANTDSVPGVVFLQDANGSRSPVPGAKITLRGTATGEAEGDVMHCLALAFPTSSIAMPPLCPK